MTAQERPPGGAPRPSPDRTGLAHAPLDQAVLDLLRRAEVEPMGVLTEASNLTLLVDLHVDGESTGQRAVYKPIRGERPLRDFPSGTLGAREVAAYLVSRAAGLDLVPPTVLRDGPLGPGSVQWWIEQEPERLADPSAGLVEILAPDQLGQGWRPVVAGQDDRGREVVVAHADDVQLRMMALLDVVLNNADRKAAHLALDREGQLRGFDHGLCLHVDNKLRTVLWGWAREELTEQERAVLRRLVAELDGGAHLAGPPVGGLPGQLATLLEEHEVEALRARVAALLADGRFPRPPGDRYPLPWPLW